MEFVTSADGDFVTVTCGEMKDADRFEPIMLRRRLIELEDGSTSLVLEPIIDAEAPPRGIGDLPPRVRLVLSALAEGATRPTEIIKAKNLPDRTVYDALAKAKEWGLITRQGAGYRLSAEGERLRV